MISYQWLVIIEGEQGSVISEEEKRKPQRRGERREWGRQTREEQAGENFYQDGGRGIGYGKKTEATRVGGINQAPKEERQKRRGTTMSGWRVR